MLTRRELIIRGITVTAAVPVLSRARAAARDEERSHASERVLVIVQLTGGNDGLNMVVPRGIDAYYRLRPTIGVPASALHPLTDEIGLHPAMSALARTFTDGRLAVVQRVGYPAPNRSHFRSMEIWHSADPDHPSRELGWLGRLADQIAEHEAGTMPLVHVGAGNLPLSCWAERNVTPTFKDGQALHLRDVHPKFAAARAALLEDAGAGDLAFLRSAAKSTYRAVERMNELASRPARGDYPASVLGQNLELVARLVTGGFGTRVFALTLDGFDTHARQVKTQEKLLRELSSSLAAFESDLAAHGWSERVTTMVFSEFGRRAEENASQGTDHGAAAPVLLVGGAVKPGAHGAAPDLEHLVDGDVPHAIDFRSVYSSLEHTWLGLRPSTPFPPLDLVHG